MNTGLPRHDTVMACPSLTGERSTSMEASAWVEASGFIWWMNGHSASGGADAGKRLRRDHDEIAPVGLFRRVSRQVSLPLHVPVLDACRPTTSGGAPWSRFVPPPKTPLDDASAGSSASFADSVSAGIVDDRQRPPYRTI